MAETAYTLNITVRNKIATTIDPATAVNGNNDYTVVFDFDSEWDSLSSKTAMFVYGREEQKYKTVTFTGNSCVMPALYNTGYVLIGVFAGDIKTTTAAYVKCIPCIRDNDSTLDTGSGGTIDTGTNDHSQLINRDLADQHPIGAITGLEEALTPLVGTTQTITPSQVFAAIKAGRDVALQHANPYLGTFVFSAFNANEKLGIVVSNSIIPHLDGVTGTLLGLVDGEEWSFRATNTATKDDVGTAVNEALAAAKASGEFDGADGLTPTIGDNGNWYLGDTDTKKPSRGEKGETGAKGEKGDTGAKGEKGDTGATGAAGKSAYQYAQDGGYTGTEEEFAEKLAAEKFANPNALTFTGAVEGSYDGSEPLTVAIPSGGEKWETILDLTLEEDVNKVVLMSGDVGYKKILVYMESIPPTDQTVTSNQAVSFYSRETDMSNAIAKLDSAYLYNGNRLSGISIELTPYAANVFASGVAGWTDSGVLREGKMGYSSKNSLSKPIKELTAQVWRNALFGVGSWFKVYGVRV